LICSLVLVEQKKNIESRDEYEAVPTLLEFSPVPVRARRDGWTPARQRRYVAALAETGHGGKAAAAVGMSEQSACRLRRRPDAADFARACADAWRLARRRWAMARLDAARSRSTASRAPPKGSGFFLPRGDETSKLMNLPRSGTTRRRQVELLRAALLSGAGPASCPERKDCAKLKVGSVSRPGGAA
jgi:hypothetical protein